MKRGFVYLFAVMDWASRRVLAWRLSNTPTTGFCIEAVQEAIHRYGKPDIFNTDQGSPFMSLEFTQLLKENGIVMRCLGVSDYQGYFFSKPVSAEQFAALLTLQDEQSTPKLSWSTAALPGKRVRPSNWPR